MADPRSPFLEGALQWLYGGPVPDVCPACGYAWDLAFQDALRTVKTAPERIASVLRANDGMVEQPDGTWNATAYVWHLVDFSRSWTERWYQIISEPGSTLVGWDPDQLADVRGYRSLPTAPALRALRSASAALVEATVEAGPDAVFLHGDWGRGDVADATIWIGHEFHHHEGDVAQRAG